jgi:hypothetical protein
MSVKQHIIFHTFFPTFANRESKFRISKVCFAQFNKSNLILPLTHITFYL